MISELRKRDRCDAGVLDWMGSAVDEELFLSVLTIGELRRGVERIRSRDQASAARLMRWLDGVTTSYRDRILDVGLEVAEAWAKLNVPDPMPVVDGLLAATAEVHDLVLVTRNVGDFENRGLELLNPFSE